MTCHDDDLLMTKLQDKHQLVYDAVIELLQDVKEFSGCSQFRCLSIGFHQRFCPNRSPGYEGKENSEGLPSTSTTRFLSPSQINRALGVSREVVMILGLEN